MAVQNNVDISAGKGTSVATEAIGGHHWQRIKLGIGIKGEAIDLSLSDPMPVRDPTLELVRGDITGHSSINKFGQNPEVASGATEDVWDGGGTYSFPATADITHIRQAVDQVAMRGQTIEAQGLDTDWNFLVQNVVLDASNTTTPVVLTTALRRSFRMKVLANVVTDQDVELRNVGGGTTYAIIQAGNNQTLMAVYTVPNGKTAYLTGFYADVVESVANDPKSTNIKLWVADRDAGHEFMLLHAKGLSTSQSAFQHFFNPYIKITQKNDIKISATPNDKAAEVHAGFDLILVDN
jgi:hypothetical protein